MNTQPATTIRPSRYVFARREDITEALAKAGIEARRYGGYAADTFTINYVHLHEDTDVAAAIAAVEALGWSNTTITDVSGMLAVETTF